MAFIDQAKANSAHVYRRNTLIGTITRTKTGSVFEYNSSFLESLSSEQKESEMGTAFHLPYSRPKTETVGVNLHPYFAGLLPEGLRLKSLIQKVKTSEDDLLSLLVAAGSDCIGDIFVLPKGILPEAHSTVADLGKLNEIVFSELFAKVISFGTEIDEVSIPGVQNKISASMISFPVRGAKDPYSYILKLTPPDKPRIIQNEHFFLRMAKACGLKVNETTIVKDQVNADGLLIKRFDRAPTKGSHDRLALHQEDACQFLNRYPADKYLIPMSEIAEGIQLCSVPIIEMGKLIRLYAFSYLIANGDLHAKNISIYNSPHTGRIELTPAYDILSTLPYGDQKMALKLDGKDDNLKRKDFITFGKRYGVAERATEAILNKIIIASEQWINRLEEIGLDEKKTSQLRRVIKKRTQDLSK